MARVPDYIAIAKDASRRWRLANGLPLDADLSSVPSFPSYVVRTERGAQEERRENRESTTKTTNTTKESREKRESSSLFPLSPQVVREVLGPRPDPVSLACLEFDVAAAVAQLEGEIRDGVIGQTPLLVRGRPLADWLDLADVARLLRAGKAQP